MARKARSREFHVVIGVVVLCTLLISTAIAVGLAIGLNRKASITPTASITPKQKEAPSFVGSYRHAAVATDSKVCSQIGTDILVFKNGTAVDAVIASLLCVGVVNLHSGGIGGGSFALVYTKSTNEVRTHDFREVAPKAATKDMFKNTADGASLRGRLSIAVPGEIAGYITLHEQHGRVPWADLFQPTIDMMKRGMVIERALARAINSTVSKRPNQQNGLAPVLTNAKTGKMYVQGDKLYLPKLVKSLERLASVGGSDYYNGTLANDIAADLKDVGSIITKDDLTSFRVTQRSPLKTEVAEYDVYTLPPPSGGAVLQFILNILRGYNLSSDSVSDKQKSVLTYHRIVEAMKFAFAKRSELGDQAFVDLKDLVKNMTSPAYGDEVRRHISDDKTHDTKYYGASFFDKDDHGTTHISAIDSEGNAVSVTSSINIWFGSSVVGKRTGIIFNDGMDDFSVPGKKNYFGLPASKANYIQPGKRSQSSMTPVIILDKKGDIKEVTGAAGGTKIITATALFIMRSLLLGKNTQDSIDLPRFHHQLVPKTLGVEQSFPEDIAEGLKKKGHEIVTYPAFHSVIQSVVKNGRYLEAVSDGRKGGLPDGY